MEGERFEREKVIILKEIGKVERGRGRNNEKK